MNLRRLAFFSGLALPFSVLAQSPCVDGMAGGYPCQHMDLLAHVVMAEIGCTANTNDIWGWVSPNSGREYALVGCANGTSFVDVSDPVDPVYIGFLPTHTSSSLWRDVETCGNYAFVGSEASGHGLQVFDLLQLDAVNNPPQTFSETAHYAGFGKSHTINIDPVSKICVAMGSNTFNGGLHLVDISNPLNPTLLGGFAEDGYTHDGFILTYDGPDPDYAGRVIVMACNADALTVVDCTDPTDCNMVDTYTYPQTGYVHQGWFTRDKKHFLVDDELDEMDFSVGTRTHIFDVTDLDVLSYEGFHQSSVPAIDHNQYVLDQFSFQSNYRSGVRVLDAIRADEGLLFPVGYFDLVPQNDNPTFSGTWSNYPYLPSGINLATSMYDGFFITKPTLLGLSQDSFELCGTEQVAFELTVNADLQFPLTLSISGFPGSPVITAAVLEEPGTVEVTLSNLLTIPVGEFTGNLELVTTQGASYHLPITLTVSGQAPVAPGLFAPANGVTLNSASDPFLFSWLPEADAVSYTFQLASDPDFAELVEQQEVPGTEFDLVTSLPDGVYYWRVRMTNSCGSGPWSEVFSFNVLEVSVSEMAAHRSLRLVPNPAGEEVFVESEGLAGEPLVMCDLTGQEVLRAQVSPGRYTRLSLTTVASGIYFVRSAGITCRLVHK